MIFVMIIAVFFVNAEFALAATVGSVTSDVVLGPIGAAVMSVLAIIAYLLTAVIGLLITVVVALLIQVAQFGNIINVPTVTLGWVIIRDLCNMFFILILLIIAFATILRQENFSAKKILPKLLLMAILINFSKMIFGLLIDVSQIIMLTFVNAFAAGGGWFIEAFQVNKWYSLNLKASGDFAVTTWSTSIAIIAGVLAAIITLIIVSVMLAVLVARIVMLWIYTIFSPLVFLGFAFPPLQKYTGKIWEDFAKQLVVGPVLAFFIWLALTTASSSSKLMGTALDPSQEVCAGIGAFFCQGNLQTFIIVIGLLMGGLMVAQQMGGAAGAIAGKGLDWAKKVAAAPGKLAGWYGKKVAVPFAEQKLEEHGFSALTRGFWQGFGARRERLQTQAKTRAMGKGEQLAEDRWKPMFWRKRKGAMNMVEEKRMEVINKIESDIQKAMGATADPRQEMQHQAKLAFEAEGIEGEQRREAIIQMATRKGNLDDVYFSMMPQLIEEAENGGEKGKTKFKEKFGMDIERAKTYNAANVRRFLAGYLDLKQDWVNAVEIDDATVKGSEEDQKAWNIDARKKVEELTKQSDQKEQNRLRTMAAASEVAKGIGHWEQFTTVKDDRTGKYKLLTDLDNFDEAIGEFRKRGVAQNLTNTATHTMRGTRWDEEAKDWIRSPRLADQGYFEKNFWEKGFTGQFVRDIHRAQTRMAPHMIGQYFDEQSGALIEDNDEARKRGFRDAADLENTMREMRKSNTQIFDALYKLMYYGRGDIEDSKGPVWERGTNWIDVRERRKKNIEEAKDR